MLIRIFLPPAITDNTGYRCRDSLRDSLLGMARTMRPLREHLRISKDSLTVEVLWTIAPAHRSLVSINALSVPSRKEAGFDPVCHMGSALMARFMDYDISVMESEGEWRSFGFERASKKVLQR